MPVTALDAVLAALADGDGRALRTANFRHRHLKAEPLLVVPFQIGGESFALAAVAWGTGPTDFNLAVVPDPRERDLFYRVVTPFAKRVEALFEADANERDERTSRSGRPITTAISAPQIVVPNPASAQLLGRIGRRLAFLDRSPTPVAPTVVNGGRHLLFLRDHLRVAGQQLLVPLTDLLASHWATPQMPAERLSLPALASWIDPPAGIHAFDAAEAAEVAFGVGPVSSGEDDAVLFGLVEQYREVRRAGDAAGESRLVQRIEEHWLDLVQPAWDLCWQVLKAELIWAEAASVPRRWKEDRSAYTRHIDWQRMAGRRRVRPTPRQAAITQYELESAASQLEVEEAIDDPLRMVPYLLRDEAVMGEIVHLDGNNRERTPGGQMRTYPLVTLASQEPCLMPIGKELWWSQDGSSWHVRDLVQPAGKGGKWDVMLRRSASVTSKTLLPIVGEVATFSILHIKSIPPNFPNEAEVPWTHRPATTPGTPPSVEPIDMIASPGEPDATDPLPTGIDISLAADVPEDD